HILQRLGLFENQQPLVSKMQTVLQQWGTSIQKAAAANTSMANGEFSAFSDAFSRQITPGLTNDQRHVFAALMHNHPKVLNQLLSAMTTIANEDTQTKIHAFLTHVKRDGFLLASPPQQQFLAIAKEMLQWS